MTESQSVQVFFSLPHLSNINTVDGRNPSPVEVGSLSHCLQGFLYPRWLARFLNHQQYHTCLKIGCFLYVYIAPEIHQKIRNIQAPNMEIFPEAYVERLFWGWETS